MKFFRCTCGDEVMDIGDGAKLCAECDSYRITTQLTPNEKTRPMETTELKSPWLEARRGYVTGTACAAICKVSPWKGPFELWSEMVLGITKPFNSEAAYWGTELEGPVMRAYQRKTKRLSSDEPSVWAKLLTNGCNTLLLDHEEERDDVIVQTVKLMLLSREHAYAACTPDFVIANYTATEGRIDLGFEGPGMGDCKTTGAQHRKAWTQAAWLVAVMEMPDTPLRAHLLTVELGENCMPPHIYCQLQWNMDIAGFSWGSIAVLFGGQQFDWRDVARDEEFLRLMHDEVASFVTLYLEAEGETEGPPMIGLDSETELLKTLHPGVAEGQEVTLSVEYAALEERKRELGTEMGILKKAQTAISNTLKGAMGSANIAHLEGSDRYLKRTHRYRAAQEATEYTEMRSMKVKR